MAMTGGALTLGITAPLALLGKTALGVAIDYESALNMMQAVSGATADQMAKVGEMAQALGADMSLPATSAADAAQAMVELSKAGLSVEESLSAARGVLQLSAAAGIDNATAAAIAARALNAFNLEGSEAERVANLLAGAANASSASITDVAFALQMSSAVASAAGISIDDLTTSIGMMANAGIVGSDAGTSLKTMIMRLQNPTDEARAAMEAFGISIFDAEGTMRPLPDIINQFTTALGSNATLTQTVGGATEKMANAAARAGEQIGPLTEKIALQQRQLSILQQELGSTVAKYGEGSIQAQKKQLAIDRLSASIAANQGKFAGLQGKIGEYNATAGTARTVTSEVTDEMRAQTLATILGTDAIRAGNILLMGGAEAFNELGEAVGREGAAADLAAARMKGLGGALEGFKSVVETALLQAALPFLGALETLVRRAAEVVDGMSNLNPQLVNAAIAFAAVLAAAGPIMLVLSGIAFALAFVLTPIGALVIGLAALAAAFAGNFGNIRTIVIDTLTALNDAFVTRFGTFQDILARLNNTFVARFGTFEQIIARTVTIISGWLTQLNSAFVERFGTFEQIFIRVAATVTTTLASLNQAFVTRFGTFEQIFNRTIAVLNNLIAVIHDAGLFSLEFAEALGPLQRIWWQVIAVVETARERITGALGLIDHTFGLLSETVLRFGPSALREIITFVQGGETQFRALRVIIGEARRTIEGIIDGIAAFLRARLPQWQAQIEAWGRAFVEWVQPRAIELLAKLGDMAAAVLRWVTAQVPGIVAQLREWGETFVEWVSPYAHELLGALGGLAGDVLGWIASQVPGIVDKLAEWGRAFVAWVAPYARELLSALGELAGRVLAWIIEQAPKLLAKLAEWGKQYVAWVKPRIPELIRELGVLLGKMAEWIIGTAAPVVVETMLTVGAALIGFAAWAAIEVIPELFKFLQSVEDYIKEDILPAVRDAAIEVGKGIVRGIGEGLDELKDWLWEKATALARSILQAAKDALLAHSPPQVFVWLGESIPRAIAIGIEATSPEAVKAVADMAKSLGDAFAGLVEGIKAVSEAGDLLASGKGGDLATFTALADWMEQVVLVFEDFVKGRGLGNELKRAKTAIDSIVPVLKGLGDSIDVLARIIEFVTEAGAETLESAAAKAREGSKRILVAMEVAISAVLEALAYWRERGLSTVVPAEAQDMLANWRDSLGVIAAATDSIKALWELGAIDAKWADIRAAVFRGAVILLSSMRDAIEAIFMAVNYWREHGMLIQVPAATQDLLANWRDAVGTIASATDAVRALWELGQLDVKWADFRAAVFRGAIILLSSLRDAVEAILMALNYWREHNMLTPVSDAARQLLENWGAAVGTIAQATDAVKTLWEFGGIEATWTEIRAAVAAGTYRVLDSMHFATAIIVQTMTAWTQERAVPQVDEAVQEVLDAWRSIVDVVAGAADAVKALWEFGKVEAKWDEVRATIAVAVYRILDILHAAAGIIVQTMTAWAQSRTLTQVDDATTQVLESWNRIVGIISGAIDSIKRLTEAGAWEMDTAQLAQAAQDGARKILEALMLTTETITGAFTGYLATNPEGSQISPALQDNADTWARIVQLVNTALSDLRSVIGGIEGPAFRHHALQGAFNFGAEWVEQIIRGIRSRLPALEALLARIRGMFPSSPAEYGPFARPLDVSDYFIKPFQAAFSDLNATLMMPDVPVLTGGGGGRTTITVTGNTFNDRRDIDYMVGEMVRQLRLHGVGV